MIAVGVVNIPIFARLLRGSVLAQRENDYVIAARSVGVRRKTILASHILELDLAAHRRGRSRWRPRSSTSPVSASSASATGPRRRPEWGTMLTDVNEYLAAYAYLAIIPGLCIVLSVLGFNLIGDGLREALDPKLRGRD